MDEWAELKNQYKDEMKNRGGLHSEAIDEHAAKIKDIQFAVDQINY